MAIVARATLARPALVACLALVAACSPAPSVLPGGSVPASTQVLASAATACEGAAVAPPTTQPDWADRVFYEIFVRSFADSDADGVGDLAGLTAELDYLNDGDAATSKDLGITGIWLMPVAASPSYHGYDVTDYTTVEPDYGDRRALDAFLDAAHARGIAVILDLVINHTSSHHPWFKDALAGGPHRDWYVWRDADPHWPPVAGDNPWHLGAKGEFYYGAFWEGMPDLNLRNPEVTAELDRIADFWLDDVGVDGFRIDAAKHLIEIDADHQINTPETLAWLADFSGHVHERHPEALVVDEVFDIARLAGHYVPQSADLTFDFGLAAAYRSALQTGRAAPITTALGETLDAWPPNRQASFLANHDQDRIISQLNGDAVSARAAAFLVLTGPGVPFLYYGEEVGMQGRKPDERIRTPMQWSSEAPAAGFSSATPWEALSEGWETANVATQDDDPTSILSVYRQGIALRQAHPGLAQGLTYPVDTATDTVTAWLRVTREEVLLIVANVGTEAVSDYGLSLGDGPLCGVTGAEAVWAIPDRGDLPAATPPDVTVSGGLDGYKPLPSLAARSGHVLLLSHE